MRSVFALLLPAPLLFAAAPAAAQDSAECQAARATIQRLVERNQRLRQSSGESEAETREDLSTLNRQIAELVARTPPGAPESQELRELRDLRSIAERLLDKARVERLEGIENDAKIDAARASFRAQRCAGREPYAAPAPPTDRQGRPVRPPTSPLAPPPRPAPAITTANGGGGRAACAADLAAIKELEARNTSGRQAGGGDENELRDRYAALNRQIAALKANDESTLALRNERDEVLEELNQAIVRTHWLRLNEAAIEEHRASLKANGCDLPATSAAPTPYAKWMTGTFSTSFGTMKLTPGGGSYDQYGGTISVTGIKDATMTGRWSQTNSGGQCANGKHGGRFSFTFNATGFTGSWSYCDAEPTKGGWNGTRQQ